MNRAIASIAAMAVCLLMLIGSSLAWGVAYEDNHITMFRGETRQFYTSLQNMVDDIDYSVLVTITGGTDIASLSQDTYDLPVGTSRQPVYVDITIPSDAPNDDYQVVVKYELAAAGSQGGVGLKHEKIVKISIAVKDAEPEPEPDPDPVHDDGGSNDNGGSNNNHGSNNPSPTPSPEPVPEPEPDKIISYPDAPSPDNTQDGQPRQSDLTVAKPVGQTPESAAVVEAGVEPFRIPVEWIVIIAVVGLVAYMLLPPKEEQEQYGYYSYQPTYYSPSYGARYA